jgi:imidazolonepropionase-like amidohydrolase
MREAAGLAVANGLPRHEALKALTINPAVIWGIDDHYGTIEPGKDADLVIWDGDPLEPTRAPLRTYTSTMGASISGRMVTWLRARTMPLRRSSSGR